MINKGYIKLHPIKRIIDNSQYFEFIREEYYDENYEIDFKTISMYGSTLSFKRLSRLYVFDINRYISFLNKFYGDYYSANLTVNPLKIYNKKSKDIFNKSSKREDTIKTITDYAKKDHYVATVSSTIY